MINEMSGERHHGDGGGDDESNGRWAMVILIVNMLWSYGRLDVTL